VKGKNRRKARSGKFKPAVRMDAEGPAPVNFLVLREPQLNMQRHPVKPNIIKLQVSGRGEDYANLSAWESGIFGYVCNSKTLSYRHHLRHWGGVWVGLVWLGTGGGGVGPMRPGLEGNGKDVQLA